MTLPTSLTSDAVAALVPPGQCQFGEDFVEVPLLERQDISKTTCVLRFGLPDTTKPLNLATCACILAGAKVAEGGTKDASAEMVVRPYTPISTNADVGYFDLLVKNYGESAHMSALLDDKLEVGQKVAFKHVAAKNVKIQAPFGGVKDIVMLVGGTGITPMIQALHAILGDADNKTKVTMFYGSKTSDDILAKELLDAWVTKYGPDKLTVEYVLSHEDESSDWKGSRGNIDKTLMEKVGVPAPDAGDAVKFFVCGPPPMYNALCGPREESDTVTGLLADMGYSASQVYKF